jgi:Zn-dependent membrane protease YugP
MTPSLMIFALLFLVISMIVSGVLKGKFSTYSKIILSSRLTGKEVAERMLKENGIYDVKVNREHFIRSL